MFFLKLQKPQVTKIELSFEVVLGSFVLLTIIKDLGSVLKSLMVSAALNEN
jgi:hypothetical protein